MYKLTHMTVEEMKNAPFLFLLFISTPRISGKISALKLPKFNENQKISCESMREEAKGMLFKYDTVY